MLHGIAPIISLLLISIVPSEFGDIEKAVVDIRGQADFFTLLDEIAIHELVNLLRGRIKHGAFPFENSPSVDHFEEIGCVRLRTTHGRWVRLSWYENLNARLVISIQGELFWLRDDIPLEPPPGMNPWGQNHMHALITEHANRRIPYEHQLTDHLPQFYYPGGRQGARISRLRSIYIERLQDEMPGIASVHLEDYERIVTLMHAPKQTKYLSKLVDDNNDLLGYVPTDNYPEFREKEKLCVVMENEKIRWRFCFYDLSDGLLGMTIRGYRFVFSKEDSAALNAIFLRAK